MRRVTPEKLPRATEGYYSTALDARGLETEPAVILDYEFLSGKDRNHAFTYAGAAPPPAGTYVFSGKTTPNGFGLLGPRIGYAMDNWLPFFRIGGVFTSGANRNTASFTDASGTATFTSGRNFKSTGFGVGFGVEYPPRRRQHKTVDDDYSLMVPRDGLFPGFGFDDSAVLQ